MFISRRYLAYSLTLVAGVAARISQNGHPADVCMLSIMSPLSLSGDMNLPVTVLGCFLVRHNWGRYRFKYQDTKDLAEAQPDAGNHLIELWNRELTCCVRDAYIEMVSEMHKIRREPSSSAIESDAGQSLGWLSMPMQIKFIPSGLGLLGMDWPINPMMVVT